MTVYCGSLVDKDKASVPVLVRTFILTEGGKTTESFMTRDIRGYYPIGSKVVTLLPEHRKSHPSRMGDIKRRIKLLVPSWIFRCWSALKREVTGRRLAKREGLTRNDVLVSYWSNHVLAIADVIRKKTSCRLEVCCHARDIYVDTFLDRIPSSNIEVYYFCCRKSMDWSVSAYSLDPFKVRFRPHPLEKKPIHKGHDTTELRILNVARDVPKKNLVAVCSLINKLNAHVINLKFIQIGAEPAKIMSMIEVETGGQFQGMVPSSRVEDAMTTCDCLVYGSRIAEDGDRDGLPNVLLEAAEIGLPVITEAGWANEGLLPEGKNLTINSLDGDFDVILAWLQKRFPEKFLIQVPNVRDVGAVV